MEDNKIIDLSGVLQQQKNNDLEIRRQEFYEGLRHADFETFKSEVLIFLAIIVRGFKNVDTQLSAASDNFRDLEKWMQDLDWCVGKIVDHVAR